MTWRPIISAGKNSKPNEHSLNSEVCFSPRNERIKHPGGVRCKFELHHRKARYGISRSATPLPPRKVNPWATPGKHETGKKQVPSGNRARRKEFSQRSPPHGCPATAEQHSKNKSHSRLKTPAASIACNLTEFRKKKSHGSLPKTQ